MNISHDFRHVALTFQLLICRHINFIGDFKRLNILHLAHVAASIYFICSNYLI